MRQEKTQQTKRTSTAPVYKGGDRKLPRMVPRKVVAALLLLSMVAMLAKQSEGYTALYSWEDFRRMQEKERNQAQKKALSVQQRSDMKEFSELSKDEGDIMKLIAPVEIRIHLKSKQLEKYQDVLKELLTEMLPDTQNVN